MASLSGATKVVPISPIARLKQLAELDVCKHHCTVAYCDTYDMFKCVLSTAGEKSFTGYARKLLWACEVAALNMLAGCNASIKWQSVGNTMTSAPLPFPDDYVSDIPDRVVTDGLKCLTGMQRAGLLKFTIGRVENWDNYHECVLQIGACTYTLSGALDNLPKRAAEFAVAYCNVDARHMESLGELLEDASSVPKPASVVIEKPEPPKTEFERVFDALATGIRAMPDFPSEMEEMITKLRQLVKDGRVTQQRSKDVLLEVLWFNTHGEWKLVDTDSISESGWRARTIRSTREEVSATEPTKPLPTVTCPAGWSLVDGKCVKPAPTTPESSSATKPVATDASPKDTTVVDGLCVTSSVSVNSAEFSKLMRVFSADVKAVPSTAGNQATSSVLSEKEYELFGKPSSSPTPIEPKTLIAEATSSKPVASDASPAPSAAIDPKVNFTVVNTEITEYIKLTNFRRAMDDPKSYLGDLVRRQVVKSFEYKSTGISDIILSHVEVIFPGKGEPMRFGKTGLYQDAFQYAAVTLFHIFG